MASGISTQLTTLLLLLLQSLLLHLCPKIRGIGGRCTRTRKGTFKVRLKAAPCVQLACTNRILMNTMLLLLRWLLLMLKLTSQVRILSQKLLIGLFRWWRLRH